MDLITLLRATARSFPEHDAIRYRQVGTRYPDFVHQTRQAARVLKDLGVQAGDRVALMCRNTPGFLQAAYGAWRLGASVVPVNHKLAAPELEYILKHCQARLCLIDGSLAGVLSHLSRPVTALSTDTPHPGLPCFDSLLAAAEPLSDADNAPLSGDSLAEILYTSGTTGKPKG